MITRREADQITEISVIFLSIKTNLYLYHKTRNATAGSHVTCLSAVHVIEKGVPLERQLQ